MTREAVIVAAALASASCGASLLKLPAGPGVPASDAAAVLAAATAACGQVRTFSAEVAVSGKLHGRKMRGTLAVGFAAPASARIEAIAPFGAPLFIFVATDDDGTLLLPRDDRYLAHAPPATLLSAVAGVPFGPADLRAIVTGCGTTGRDVVGAQQIGSTWRRVQVSGGRNLYLHRDDRAWRLVAMVASRTEAARVEYAGFDGDVARSIHLVEYTGPGAPPSGYDLRLTLSQIEINIPLEADVFRVQIPRSADPMTLDELRRIGPVTSQSE